MALLTGFLGVIMRIVFLMPIYGHLAEFLWRIEVKLVENCENSGDSVLHF